MKVARFLLVLFAMIFGRSMVIAQCVENIRMYDLGMKLYYEGKYREAADAFALVDSLDKLDFDEHDARIGYGKHWQAYCLYKSNDIEKAKSLSEESYDILPVDRRVLQIPDSLLNIVRIYALNGEYEKALSLNNQSLEIMRSQKLTNYIQYFYCLLGKAEIIALKGDKDVFVSMADSILAEFDQEFPNHPRTRKYVMKYLLDISLWVEDSDLYRKYYELLVGYLKATNQYEDAFTLNVLNSYINFSLNHGEFLAVDEMSEEWLRLAEILFGKDSWQFQGMIGQFIDININLKRLDIAKKYIDLGDSLMAILKGNKKDEWSVLLNVRKSNYYYSKGDTEEALKHVKRIYRHADHKTEFGRTCLAIAIPFIGMLKSVQGKVDNGLISDMKQIYERMKDEATDSTNNIKVLLMQAFMASGYTKEAVQIADELTNSFTTNFNVYCSFMTAYLMAGEYIKARKAGHQALEKLNETLGQQRNVSTALGLEANVDSYLNTVRTIKSQKAGVLSSAPDTTKYALNLLQQDLLQAKLRILEQKDSIGSENFMSTLESFYFCAYNDNKDAVIADSILNEYSSKCSSRFGADSEQIEAIVSIKERCEFERENYTAGIKLRIYEKGSDLYNKELEEYNKKFDEWKQKKANPIKEEQQQMKFEPKFPSWWNVRDVANSDSVFKEVWKVLQYYEAKNDYFKMLLHAHSWCYSAQKANRIDSLSNFAKRIIPKIQFEHDSQKMLGYLWLYAGETLFDECLSLICNGQYDAEIELGGLLYAINERDIYCKNVDLEPIMNRINRILKRYKQSTDKDDKMRYYTALIYTNLVRWNNAIYWRIDESQIKQDFVKMYHEIGNEKSLWEYRDFNKSLDIACLLHEYDKDSVVVEINRTRMLAQIEASKPKDNTWGVSWIKTSDGYEGKSLPGKIAIYDFDIYEKDIDKLYNIVYYAYYRQKKYELDYDFYMYWVDFFKKHYASKEEKLSIHIEKLLDDMVEANSIKKNKDDRIYGLAYDLAIWNKGYLLRSDQQVAKTLLESGNKTILERYKEYIDIKQRISDSKTDEKTAASLKERAESIWKNLKSESKTFDDYTKYLDANWKDVQACLGEKDLAIEYVCKNDCYYALLLRHDYSSPVIDCIGNIDRIVKEKGDSIYTNFLSYDSPWPYIIYDSDSKKLIYPFKGVENVYFSPAGSLSKLSMENMIADEGSDSLMSEKYHMHRLSNTRDLLSKPRSISKEKKKKAVLFGGINYDLSQEQWAEVALSNQNGQLYALRSNDLTGRGAQNISLSYLKGTQNEVERISAVLETNRVHRTSYTGNDATEDLFKSLSGQEVTSLHIATHGFYSSDSHEKQNENYGQPAPIEEDKSMMQNGLYFAGANANFYGDIIPDNANDGILTAQEVSYLDFTDCELVSLSACETGLGEVSGEGIFGLQRGFKKAGVNSILMSLWKVDDEATCKLMTEFYSNWIGKKMTKHDALEAAKRVVRETKGWENPKYWAAFILLDALD